MTSRRAYADQSQVLGDESIEAVLAARRARDASRRQIGLDPRHILNPGKIF
jgi:hypothetical protein